jgi:toxin ParE1/3/4
MASIQEFVGSRNKRAAERIGAAIGSAVQFLQTFPNSGRRGRAPGTREWLIRGLPYIIVYKVSRDEDELQILGIFHTAQNRPDNW